MTTRSLPNELSAQLEAIARREKRSPEAVLQSMFDQYKSPQSPSAPDVDAIRQARLRTYARARRYWQQVGDTERLALTDKQLDEQFWLIDLDGVPHLMSEQGTIEISPDPLLLMAQAADQLGLRSDPDDLSEHFDDFLRETWADYLARKWGRDAE